MPHKLEENEPLTLIGVLLKETGEALRRYADSGQGRPFPPEELTRLAEAWNGAGQVLADIAESPAGRSPQQLTVIARELTTVRDVLRAAGAASP